MGNFFSLLFVGGVSAKLMSSYYFRFLFLSVLNYMLVKMTKRFESGYQGYID